MKIPKGSPQGLMPFFCYYGGKTRTAHFYPRPLHDRIIEPFAGSAGYALRYHFKEIILYEKDHRVAAVWSWLINATRQDVLSLPVGKQLNPKGLSRMKSLSEPKRWLMGYWFYKGSSNPLDKPTPRVLEGNSSYWGAAVRARIAVQVERIRHWIVFNDEYWRASNRIATWFIDPPYQNMGKYYTFGCDQLDFSELGEFCRSRLGQVIVCENEGADWLPFRPFRTIAATNQGGRHASREVIWLSPGQEYPKQRRSPTLWEAAS